MQLLFKSAFQDWQRLFPETLHWLVRDGQLVFYAGGRIKRHKFLGGAKLQRLQILCSAGCISLRCACHINP